MPVVGTNYNVLITKGFKRIIDELGSVCVCCGQSQRSEQFLLLDMMVDISIRKVAE